MKVAKLICLAAISFCAFALASHFLSQFGDWWSIAILLVAALLIAVLIWLFADALGDWLGLSPKIVMFQSWIIAISAIVGGILAWIN